MEKSVFSHVQKRFSEAHIEEFPYPHFFIENIFPEDFYQEILTQIPAQTSYKKLSDLLPGISSSRYALNLEPRDFWFLPKDQGQFWSEMSKLLFGEEWIAMLKTKFHTYLKERFEDQYESIDFFSKSELYKDTTDYSIGPHTDIPEKVIVLLFYFPENESLRHLGTSVYRPWFRSYQCEGHQHYAFERFEEISKAPFLPNSVFGFIKSRSSFHGVEPIESKKLERNLLQYSLSWDPDSSQKSL